jgi:regulator of replication initiation timing
MCFDSIPIPSDRPPTPHTPNTQTKQIRALEEENDLLALANEQLREQQNDTEKGKEEGEGAVGADDAVWDTPMARLGEDIWGGGVWCCGC